MYLLRRIVIPALIVVCQTAGAEKKTVYAVSDAHLDTQWNWDVRTSIRDYLRYTLGQNLLLLTRHPDYVFNFEGGVKYAWMKEYYPDQYELMKQYIKQGRWHVAGASWDANDVIVPSIESQLRNIMLGQNFYRKEFGVESTDIFLPDCFGFGWTLPTVARHCGLIGFSSQKIGWRTHPFFENDRKYPFGVGLWKGVDGDTIMMVHGYSYTHTWDGEDISHSRDLEKLADENAGNIVYHYYGVGDRGGSPTIGSIRSVERGIRGDGPLKIISATSDRLYLDMQPYSSHPELPLYDDEMLMDVHGNGCYTAMAVMKFYNRQNELLGDAAERAASAAAVFAGSPYPTESFTESWKRFIWHQFHDDITGTSEPPCYEISFNDELLSLKQFSDLLTDAATAIATRLDTDVRGMPLLLFNPLGYETTDVVEVQIEAKHRPASATVRDHNGRTVRSQVTGYADGKATVLIEATVPAIGFAVYDVALRGKGKEKTATATSGVSNSVYSLAFDRNGDISSIIDRRSGRQLVADGKAVRLAMFSDNISTMWPAWEIQKETIDREPASIGDSVAIALVDDGALLRRVRITKRHGDSEFTQYVNLYEGALAPRIDIVNEVEWHSPASLLKAEFPLTVSNEKATYDLGVGVIERGNNVTTAYEVPAREWVDLSDGSYGVTLLSNFKYGWDKPADNTLRLSLFHSPGVSNRYSHQERQDFGHHEFTYSIIGHDGRLDRVSAARAGERMSQRIKAFVVPKTKGEGRSLSLASTDAPNVVIKAMKRAEDGDGYIVRVYETAGRPTQANIVFATPLRAAQKADGTEKVIADAAIDANRLPVSLKANGIATYRVRFDEMKTVSPKMAAVPLPYNYCGITYNSFRHDGRLNGGLSYPAEIMPDEIARNGVRFNIEKRPADNVVLCSGDTIALPEGKWDKLHLLMAADTEGRDLRADLTVGATTTTVTVPSYTGYIGQWGHDAHNAPGGYDWGHLGFSKGYLKKPRVVYAGTHRHSLTRDEIYENAYLWDVQLDLPAGADTLILPDDLNIILVAATVTAGAPESAVAATPLFSTANRAADSRDTDTISEPANILTPDMIISYTGGKKESGHPARLLDNNVGTKWSDRTLPASVVFDLGKPTVVTGWTILCNERKRAERLVSGCFLLGRNSPDEEWRTLDFFTGNSRSEINRRLSAPEQVRYIRLTVTQPSQEPGSRATGISEFRLY